MKTAEANHKQPSLAAPSLACISPKIQSAHLERLAVVYVRQSSHHQVMEHRESRARQYALKDHAQFLGWPAERVLVIDEDQGLSGTSAELRSGFQRLLSEVALDHVGLVLALETSRLARNSRDWHQLFELCGLFGTLLADQEGIYNPNDANDRLVLGLKGIMNEMELQTMRNRLYQGKLNKAQRGELFCSVPRGYVILPNGNVDHDPDEQVRTVVQFVFDKFEELGSARRVLLWFTNKKIELPKRLRSGERKGDVEWRSPYLAAINRMLHHPIYAGAYSFGRFAKANQPSAQRKYPKWNSTDDCSVLIQDCLPAYITWDQFQRNQEQLKENRSLPTANGIPRQGLSLLAGLVVCGHCGWRLQVGYHAPNKLHYRCQRSLSLGIKTPCCTLSGNGLDALVARQVLKALEPASIQLSLKAQADILRERERLDKHWKQKLKRSRYDVESAERRYRAVDAENRLVAATLEKQWEETLRSERTLQEDYDRAMQRAIPKLTPDEEERIVALSSEIPDLWSAPDTTNADRQSIIRCLVEKVVVYANLDSEYTDVTIHWVGGWESRLDFRRPVRAYEQMRDFEQLADRVKELSRIGHSARQTAEILNEEGFSPTDPERTFNRPMIQQLRKRIGLHDPANGSATLLRHEWWLRDLASHLKMRWVQLQRWAKRGWVHARQTSSGKRWIIWADEDEIVRLRQLLVSDAAGVAGYPEHLKIPKNRTDQP